MEGPRWLKETNRRGAAGRVKGVLEEEDTVDMEVCKAYESQIQMARHRVTLGRWHQPYTTEILHSESR